MKIHKSLKLPRKLKKEVKKGITRNVTPNYPVFYPVCRENGTSLSMYETVSYSGSNTKAFRRLLKYLLRLQKIQFVRMNDLTIKLDLIEEVESVNVFKSEFDNFKKFNANLKSVHDDIITASCISLYCEDQKK